MKARKEWEELAAGVMSGIREWSNQHPKATFAEIERETMRRMAELQARLMRDVAQEIEEAQGTIECPECGATVTRGQHQEKRELQAVGGQEIRLDRGYTVCTQCGAGFFPPG